MISFFLKDAIKNHTNQRSVMKYGATKWISYFLASVFILTGVWSGGPSSWPHPRAEVDGGEVLCCLFCCGGGGDRPGGQESVEAAHTSCSWWGGGWNQQKQTVYIHCMSQIYIPSVLMTHAVYLFTSLNGPVGLIFTLIMGYTLLNFNELRP